MRKICTYDLPVLEESYFHHDLAQEKYALFYNASPCLWFYGLVKNEFNPINIH